MSVCLSACMCTVYELHNNNNYASFTGNSVIYVSLGFYITVLVSPGFDLFSVLATRDCPIRASPT